MVGGYRRSLRRKKGGRKSENTVCSYIKLSNLKKRKLKKKKNILYSNTVFLETRK